MPINTATLRLVRYPPERLVDATIANIPAGGALSPAPLSLTPILGSLGYLVELTRLATTQVAGVTPQVRADQVVYPSGQNTAATPQLTQQAADHQWELVAANDLLLNFGNGGTAAVNQYQAWWSLWAWTPTTADRMILGLPRQPDDGRLEQLLPQGYVQALYPERILALEYARPYRWPIAGTANVPAGGNAVTIAYGTPPRGWFDAVEGIAVDASIGGTVSLATQQANGLTVHLQRDGDLDVLDYPAAGVPLAPLLGSPGGTNVYGPIGGTAPFVVSRQSWQVYLTSQASGVLSGVPYRVLVGRYREYDAHRVRWGLSPQGSTHPDLQAAAQAAPAALRDAVLAGVA